ncbi:PLD5 phospholipase, partial [Polypterus senegalus]
MEARHGRLPAEGFDSARLKSRAELPSTSLTRVGNNVYCAVQQQDYTASVWLRRKDKLEHVSTFPSLYFKGFSCFSILFPRLHCLIDCLSSLCVSNS